MGTQSYESNAKYREVLATNREVTIENTDSIVIIRLSDNVMNDLLGSSWVVENDHLNFYQNPFIVCYQSFPGGSIKSNCLN